MPVQLSLDGTPKLIGKRVTRLDFDIVIEANKGHCQAEADRVGSYADLTDLYQRLGFAILSVNAPFDATCKAWEAFRQVEGWDRLAIRQAIATPGSDGVVSYQPTKARWLVELWSSMYQSGLDLRPCGDDQTYRDYVRRSVTGLAWAKSSFGTMLVKGSADVACIDTHMYRVFTGKHASKVIRKAVYLELEGKVRRLAKRHGIKASVCQHAIWDAARGQRSVLLPEIA